jgi:hypothetical protein
MTGPRPPLAPFTPGAAVAKVPATRPGHRRYFDPRAEGGTRPPPQHSSLLTLRSAREQEL